MATASSAPSAPVSLGAPSFLRSRPRAERTGRRYPECTERIVTVRDGVQLAVRDQGPSRAEATVVLLHGLCLEKGSWAGQIRHLTRQWGDRIRIISYDHRGHGTSGSAPNRTYTVASDLIPPSRRDASGRASPTVDQAQPGRPMDAPAHEITSPALSNQGAGPMKPTVGHVKWLVAALTIRRSHCQRYAPATSPDNENLV
jgi:alpha/beta hydrolase fold